MRNTTEGHTINFVPSKHNAVLKALDQDDANHKLEALKFIKNSVIGNKTNKLLYNWLGLLLKLVSILKSPSTSDILKTEASVVLGSFAHGDEKLIESVVQAGAIKPLLLNLGSKDLKLVEASGRALKSLFQNPNVPREDVYATDGAVDLILNLLHQYHVSGEQSLSEIGAALIAKCCETRQHQTLFFNKGAIDMLLKLAYDNNQLKAQEAAIDGLTSLCRDNVETSKLVYEYDGFRKLLFELLYERRRPGLSLISATCFVNFYKSFSNAARNNPGYVGKLSDDISDLTKDITVSVLPVLLRLLVESNSSIKERAPFVLSYLVLDDEEMQKAAAEVDTISKLSALLNHHQTQLVSLRQKESVLFALAACCSIKEECRKQLIEAKVLPVLVKLLEHEDVSIRAASCTCMRSLSRSVKNLRTYLVDAGVALPLVRLLNDSSSQVQTTACATICNIVLDFSPMKKIVLENGGVEKLIELTNGSNDANLRLNAVWALKNLLFQADSALKTKIIEKLTFGRLNDLLNDNSIQIQEQALNLLRNFACGNEGDIDQVFVGLGERTLIKILEDRLSCPSIDLVMQALYVVVNISTGNEGHKRSIINSEKILKSVYDYMGHEKADVRVATVWCIINLTWPEDSGATERAVHLKGLYFEDRLRQFVNDDELDVKDRVKTALQHFSELTSNRMSISE